MSRLDALGIDELRERQATRPVSRSFLPAIS